VQFAATLPGNPQLRAAFFQNESGIPEAKLRAMIATIMLAAAGWSLLYLLMGGGFGGALLIFIVLKMFGK
jgi:hypothetical protein